MFSEVDEAILHRVQQKIDIIKAIKQGIDERGLSIRDFGRGIGMKHPQIHRVLSGENYNIATILKILSALDLELAIRKKGEVKERLQS